MKNLLGNWEIAPIYTYESPEYATVQSQEDSNLNGDPWGDRVFINPNGVGSSGTDVTPIDKSGNAVPYQVRMRAETPFTNPVIAGYVANDPNGKVRSRVARLRFPKAVRNTLPIRPINNFDLTILKRFSITERVKFEFQGQFSNAFNHPQYTGGFLNHVDGGDSKLWSRSSRPAEFAICSHPETRSSIDPTLPSRAILAGLPS